MKDYNFSALNDKEFENITVDLISRDRGKRFERFKVGRDGGIDGRYYGEGGKQEIIQCKHYLKTGYKGLISSLKKNNSGKTEADKVKLLDPEKYIFVTSLSLSVSNKQEIKEIFEPYIKNDNDIYGQEDLNDLLKNNSDIEENHYKLWISSTTVLQRILNNAIKGRSEFLIEDIQDKIKYYVLTENHNLAVKKLEELHTIIIAGEPGIGKTTLAEQISLNYIEKGFEFCVISKDISDAESIFERSKKQVFYFDDFLGSNYLNALEAHTDSQIMRFISRVKNDKNKRFILTSRTNIFSQSLLLSDKFRTNKLDNNEFVITVCDLEDMNKAKILYNHIWHSNLSEEYIDEIYKDKRYKEIINHRNFNPRLIEFITDTDRINSLSPQSYWQDVQNNLNSPSEIWANTFDEQSDEFIRNIVVLVVFNGNIIEESELKKAYYRLNGFMKLKNNSHNSKEFDSIIKKTEKYFLRRKLLKDGRVEYTLFNPSIADFVISDRKNNIEYIFKSLKTRRSLDSISNLYENNILDDDEYKKIIALLDFRNNDNENYLILLAGLLYNVLNYDLLEGDNSILEWKDNILAVLEIIEEKESISEEYVLNLVKIIGYFSYNYNYKISKDFLKKIIEKTPLENYELHGVFYAIKNEFKLEPNEFKYFLDIFNNRMEEFFIEDYDSPSYISDKTIKKIELLILKDAKKQANNYIDKMLDSVFSFNSNKEFLINNFSKVKIVDKIKKNIIENCIDRFSYELFDIDNNANKVKGLHAKEDDNPIETIESKIDDLFERG